MMPLPKEDTTPPVTKIYFVSATIVSVKMGNSKFEAKLRIFYDMNNKTAAKLSPTCWASSLRQGLGDPRHRRRLPAILIHHEQDVALGTEDEQVVGGGKDWVAREDGLKSMEPMAWGSSVVSLWLLASLAPSRVSNYSLYLSDAKIYVYFQYIFILQWFLCRRSSGYRLCTW